MSGKDSNPNLLDVSTTDAEKDYEVIDLGVRITNLDRTISSLNCTLLPFRKDVKGLTMNDITVSQVERKYSKPDMASRLLNMAQQLECCMFQLDADRKLITKFQTWTIKSQNEKLKLQDDVIKCQENQLEEFKTTMKTEVKSWSEVLAKNVPSQVQASVPMSNGSVSPKQIESAVKKVVSEEDRSKNLMVYGVKELENEDVDKLVSNIMSVLGEKPRVVERRRIGAPRSDRPRPIRVTLTSGDFVRQILRKSGNLKKSENHKTTFIEPDRSVAERVEHRKLVSELKKRMESDPNQYHCIRLNKIISFKKTEDSET